MNLPTDYLQRILEKVENTEKYSKVTYYISSIAMSATLFMLMHRKW